MSYDWEGREGDRSELGDHVHASANIANKILRVPSPTFGACSADGLELRTGAVESRRSL